MAAATAEDPHRQPDRQETDDQRDRSRQIGVDLAATEGRVRIATSRVPFVHDREEPIETEKCSSREEEKACNCEDRAAHGSGPPAELPCRMACLDRHSLRIREASERPAVTVRLATPAACRRRESNPHGLSATGF